MDSLQAEMAHAVRLLEDSASSFRAWVAYFRAKSQDWAQASPEFEQYPVMLEAEIERIKATLRARSEQPSPPSKRTPSESTPKPKRQRA